MIRGKIKYAVAVLCGAAAIMLLASAGTDAFRVSRGMEILVNMFRELSLFHVDEPDPDMLLRDAAAGMTSSLDPYTEFISEEDMASFEVMTRGKYGGIGSLIRQQGDWVIFAEPYKGSPADKAGIVIGDRIEEIDGKSAKGMSPSQISNMLMGDPGTTVRLTVRRFYSGEVEQIRIKREIISLPAIPYYGMVSDTVGYILHSDFSEDCSSDMRNTVMDLRKRGAKALILDYRNNGGGVMQEAVKILSFFVPKGTEVVSMRGRTAETSAVFITQNEPIDPAIPIVALVNGGSASAAEIVAGALQDLDRGVLMGRRTFGKGLVQSPRPLGYNNYLKLTTAKYYLPSGRCIQAIDYARRDDEGNLTYIPDSLITQYATLNGRRVYDGGGVMPDIRTEPRYVSRFAYILYARNYIYEFADRYCLRNAGKAFDLDTFALTDADYADFTAFMEDKDVQWESDTKRAIRQLREKATQERYIDSIEEELKAMEAAVHDDKEANLLLHKKELTEYIENDIVLRYAYAAGVAAYNTKKDEEVDAAIELLGDPARYRMILSSQDTERK